MLQVDPDSVEFKRALRRLNKCIEKKNLDALWTIQQKKDLKEEDIVVGIGNHLISKLAGRALTNKAKSQLNCPCGCSAKLEYGEKTYIGMPGLYFVHFLCPHHENGWCIKRTPVGLSVHLCVTPTTSAL